MNRTGKEIFRAIHEGRWLEIEYRNRSGQVTKYWIGIQDMNMDDMSLTVCGLHLGTFEMARLNKIYMESILTASVIEGTYECRNEALIADIRERPERYESLFGNVANLKILNYLSECSRLDTTPYHTEYTLLELFDREILGRECVASGSYRLSANQFTALVREFGRDKKREVSEENPAADGAVKRRRYRGHTELGLNLLSVRTGKGLYVLAYRGLLFDVKNFCLRPEEAVTICTEFRLLTEKQSIRSFLDQEDYGLLDDFEKNAEEIKDRIASRYPHRTFVDDMPYLIAVGRDRKVDLMKEYDAIAAMYDEGKEKATYPLRAFFGDMTARPVRRREYPFALLNQKYNLDQLLAIHNAMKYPLAYVQGPPGTGKTSTIINAITTAFFNEKTVLLASYNNHPIDGVYKELSRLACRRGRIPFPVVRLGNQEKVEEALLSMRRLYEETAPVRILENTLNDIKKKEENKLKELSGLLKRYEEALELKDTEDAMDKLEETQDRHWNFYADLHGRQRRNLERRQGELGEISLEDARRLLPADSRHLLDYFYYASARFIKRLDREENKELKRLIFSEEEDRVQKFDKYLSEPENMERFLKVFPIVLTTCISAHKLGEARPCFDMTILDEASQCNVAVSLLAILRGRKLMLVGDPQQLSPVVTLNPQTNELLKKRYYVTDEYDYIGNSIYKTYLACDSVSDETLLSHHYRCHKKIIGFNNQKYYNSKLKVESRVESEEPLLYVEVRDDGTSVKNASMAEAAWIAGFAREHPDKQIGVITPFVNQKECIRELLRKENLPNVSCGTVHAFQGDEKDVILFSLAVTGHTKEGTYGWLKNNRELINVATSRAREKLVVLGDAEQIDRLHGTQGKDGDDLYELVQYVRANAETVVTPRNISSRALGIRPYSTKTEEAFLENLSAALHNVLNGEGRCSIRREVPVKQVFRENVPYSDLFYSGQFDFVVYQRAFGRGEMPVLAIELDGREHLEDEVVRARDRKKEEICASHQFELIRIDNSYARRYYHIREILADYFRRANRG
ncbi:MAG: AAA family ATPase [Lachnospiraceae bacterium]|nr:AAA family ATPase [Lachnospiraceae bacterium]